jgi:hypothetical protein
MTDDTKEIPRREWRQFLDEFTREHQGWQVVVEVDDPEAGSQVEAHDLPLQGIAADEHDVAVIVGEEVNPALTHIIHGARSLWVRETSRGNVSTLEIQSTDGSKTRVRLTQVPQAA